MSPRDDKGPSWRVPRDRDEYTDKHAAPEFISEEGTGQVEGPALRAVRARRPTPERIARLEDKHDKLALTVAGLDSKVDTLLDLASKAEAERARRSELDALERERKRRMVVPTIKAVAAAIALIIAALVGKGAL